MLAPAGTPERPFFRGDGTASRRSRARGWHPRRKREFAGQTESGSSSRPYPPTSPSDDSSNDSGAAGRRTCLPEHENFKKNCLHPCNGTEPPYDTAHCDTVSCAVLPSSSAVKGGNAAVSVVPRRTYALKTADRTDAAFGDAGVRLGKRKEDAWHFFVLFLG